jgi:hypothetical protein
MRIPNYKIDDRIATLSNFENYNGTIRGWRKSADGHYVVWHWNTMILDYDPYNDTIAELRGDYISQTTSTLVGRILRALPRKPVENFIGEMADTQRAKQLKKMISWSRS